MEIADDLKWLVGREAEFSLFMRISRRFLRVKPEEVNEQMRQLSDQGLVKQDGEVWLLSEKGRRIHEALEALSFLDEVK